MTNRQLVLIAAGFAVFLTACDQVFHVRTGTLVYHWGPQVVGQTFIVPLTFFLAGVAMLDASRRARPDAATTTTTVLASLGLVSAAYLASGLLAPAQAGAYAMVLLIAWVVRVVRRRDRARVGAVCLVIAVGGVLAESALSGIGEFAYVHPDLLGVPWWLFPLYLHGAVVAVDIVALARTRVGQLQAA